MKILVSGSTGLIGRALVPFLRAQGHTVVRLVRKAARDAGAISWDPETGSLDKSQLEGFDLVYHLAGENIASRRWSKAQKKRLFCSRCRDSWLLAQALTRLSKPPKSLIAASGCGYYGDRGAEILTEQSPPGAGFIADLCVQWESAAGAPLQHGIRVVHTRFGLALSREGGFLAKMLPFFRLGLGAVLGSGEQFIPWIALEDLVQALYHVAIHEEISGPINLTSPNPVTQKEFTSTLARALHRPAFLRLPAPLLRLIFGEMADELLLVSENVHPERLLASGFLFRYAKLEDAFAPIFS